MRIIVWDVTFCKVDDDGITLKNEDGSVKLFHDPNVDYLHLSEYVAEEDLIEYEDK